MKTGIMYIVTKHSEDQSFERGDHVKLEDNGDISCIEACGWIEKADVEEATKGWEIEVDTEYAEKRKRKLLLELEKLNGMAL